MRPALVLSLLLMTLSAFVADARTITFSGHTWMVRTSGNSRQGPGPNYFSDSDQNVWIDSYGRLHLRITKVRNRWECAEVVSLASFGYGTYRFYLDTPVADLDPNVVLGLFTYSSDPAYSHREIDIEFTRWSVRRDRNAQYTFQPASSPGALHRFAMPSIEQSTHSFVWAPHAIDFTSNRRLTASPGQSDIIEQWSGFAGIPIPGGETPRINLWLHGGQKPQNNRPVEVIVNRVEFLSQSQ